MDFAEDFANPSEDLKAIFNQVVSDLRRSSLANETWAAIDRLCYWEPAIYSLEMKVNTSRPDKSFHRKWKFSLTEDDSKTLHINAIKIVNEACYLTAGQYVFAFAQYNEE